MTKENKNYICCRIQENTFENLGKALTALSDVFADEHFYNYELADECHTMRMKVVAMMQEARKVNNKFKSVLDD